MSIYIFAGRFQPFHNGHLQVLQQACEKLTSNDTLVLAVISPFKSDDVADESFLESSLEHHHPNRNPWDISVPLKAITQIAQSCHCCDQIITTLMPRPEYGWRTITEWFPQKRIWVIPSADEAFDEKKSDFFKKMGDTVVRFEDTTEISGRELRNWYKEGNHKSFIENVPECVGNIYLRKKSDENTIKDFQERAKNFEQNSKWVIDKRINSVPQKFLSEKNNMGNLLDAGGGTGYLSYFLSKTIDCKSISLVDISKNMLDIAIERETKEKKYKIKIFNSSIECFCNMIDEKFDTILIRQVLHYVDSVDNVISLLKSVLNDNGVIYVGQILVDDEKCREWHNELTQSISKNRRRTFLYDEFLEIFCKNGFEIINSELTDYEDTFDSFYKRRIYDDVTFDELKNKMETLVSNDILEKMSIRITDDNIYFTVKFCHLLLKKST
jgi:cytidyltransferase-like protein